MVVDFKTVGSNFYELMQDQGEDYTITRQDGSTYTGKISMIANTRSSYMLAEREYLFNGVATFPDMKAQSEFRGCYFQRELAPEKTYIMVSTMPEPTTPHVATMYCVQCNETVSLANLETVDNEFFDKVTVPVKFAENVKCYFDSTMQRQNRRNDGNIENTLFFAQIPARYGLSVDQVVLRKAFKWDDTLKKNVLVEERYRVESIDLSMTEVTEDGEIYGIMDTQLSVDMRA